MNIMSKPDLLLTQIKHVDYPIWRLFLKRHRDFFGKIIVFFNENNRFPYLDHFMHDSMIKLGNIEFLDQKQIDWGTQDWRNVSTNEMLKRSISEWVCSVEQDFFTRDWNKLFEAIIEASRSYEIIGFQGHQGQEKHQNSYLTGNYVHPAFWFIKRELLEKTSQNFSADTNKGCDHFGLITQDLERMQCPIWYTQEHGFSESDTYHLGSVNQNYLAGLDDPNYAFHRGELFYLYNYYCMKAEVIQSPIFMDMMIRMNNKLKVIYPNIDPETDIRKEFFI